MSNVLFGREVSAATGQPVTTQNSATATETVTGNVRGIAGLIFWCGVVACFTPAIALGVVLAIVGGFVWWVAPANAERTQAMVDEAAQGGAVVVHYGQCCLLWSSWCLLACWRQGLQ